ncbi:hypothetical protein OY671_011589, partial [Metschnikowia pulcherrima]
RQDRQAGKTPPAARDRPHRHRQAPRLRLSLHGGLRRRGPRAGARRLAGCGCRSAPRHDAGRGGARAHPCRQRLSDPARPRRRLLSPHQQAVEHGVPRLRRAAGRAGDGGCARPHRPPSRPRRQRDPRPQFLWQGRRRDALWPEGRREPLGASSGRGEAGGR